MIRARFNRHRQGWISQRWYNHGEADFISWKHAQMNARMLSKAYPHDIVTSEVHSWKHGWINRYCYRGGYEISTPKWME
jgi:hypothetical protein